MGFSLTYDFLNRQTVAKLINAKVRAQKEKIKTSTAHHKGKINYDCRLLDMTLRKKNGFPKMWFPRKNTFASCASKREGREEGEKKKSR